jgi:hypothetical protein
MENTAPAMENTAPAMENFIPAMADFIPAMENFIPAMADFIPTVHTTMRCYALIAVKAMERTDGSMAAYNSGGKLRTGIRHPTEKATPKRP